MSDNLRDGPEPSQVSRRGFLSATAAGGMAAGVLPPVLAAEQASDDHPEIGSDAPAGRGGVRAGRGGTEIVLTTWKDPE